MGGWVQGCRKGGGGRAGGGGGFGHFLYKVLGKRSVQKEPFRKRPHLERFLPTPLWGGGGAVCVCQLLLF